MNEFRAAGRTQAGRTAKPSSKQISLPLHQTPLAPQRPWPSSPRTKGPRQCWCAAGSRIYKKQPSYLTSRTIIPYYMGGYVYHLWRLSIYIQYFPVAKGQWCGNGCYLRFVPRPAPRCSSRTDKPCNETAP